ncbi:MAG: hypothetical protein RLZZ627_132 [Pseudomonadota bacterium]
MRTLVRKSAELVLLVVFVSGFLITLGLMGDFWRSFSHGLAREPVPEGPSMPHRTAQLLTEHPLQEKSISDASMVIWISEPDSDWQSLVAGLRRQDLPFRMAHSMKDLDAPVILVYPTFSGKAIPPQIYKHLLKKVRSGSVLITQNTESELGPRFGFQKARYSLDESHICLDGRLPQCKDQGHKWTSLRFEKPDGEVSSFETMGYVGAKHPLAKFESGDAALIMNPFGKGALYAFGLDIGATVRQSQGIGLPIKPIMDADSENVTTWIYEQIQAIYLNSGASDPLFKKSSQAKPEALITHELRKEGDLLQAVRWAALEARLGVKALYIIDYAFLRSITPDFWISPLTKAQLASITRLGHGIALGWLEGSPSLDALEKGSGAESIQWMNDEGGRNQPRFPSSQTGVLRIGKQVLEEGYGLGRVEIFVTAQELIPGSFEKALRESGFRYLIRSGFKANGPDLPMLVQPSAEVTADQELTLFPSRIRVESLSQGSPDCSGSSMTILDLPLGSDAEEHIKSFFDQLNESVVVTELSQYRKQDDARSNLKLGLERYNNKYEIKLESPVPLGGTTILLPSGIQKIYGLPKACPRRVEAEVKSGETRIELCHRSRKSQYRSHSSS